MQPVNQPRRSGLTDRWHRPLEAGLLLAILALAAGLRLPGLGEQPLWLDEAVTFHAAQLPLPVLLTRAFDTHPPLFYLLEKAALQSGGSEAVLRALPAVCGVATVGVVYLIGRRHSGVACALVAALLLAVSAPHVEYSREARSYSLLLLEMALAAAGLLGFLRANEGGTARGPSRGRGAAVLYGLCALAALYTHVVAALYLALLNLAVLLAWRPLGRLPAPALRRWLLLNLGLAILWLPWLRVLLEQARGEAFTWLDQVPPGEALRSVAGLYGFRELWRLQPFADAAAALLLVAGLAGGAARGRVRLALVAGLLALGVPALVWLVGLAKPIFLPRTILAGLLGSALAFGLAAAALRSRLLALALAAALALPALRSTTNFLALEAKADWRAAAGLLEARAAPGDLLLFCRAFAYLPYGYYAAGRTAPQAAAWDGETESLLRLRPEAIPAYVAAPQGTKSAVLEPWSGALREVAGRGGAVWLVAAHCPEPPPDLRRRLEAAGFARTRGWSPTAIGIARYAPTR